LDLIWCKLKIYLINHVHYTPFICGKALLKFWNFQFLNVNTLNFQNLRIPQSWNFECFFSVFNRLLSFHIFYHQLICIIWILWIFLVKRSFFNDRNFHFQRFLTKQKPEIGSNGFLIWGSWHSCVLKKEYCAMITMVSNGKKKILNFLWQNLTSDAICDSFNCVLTYLSSHDMVVGWLMP